MTPGLLDRASLRYRQGYWDAAENKPARTDYLPGTFEHHDYNDGYNAGFNEMYWDAVRENRTTR
jgi:hypothetical protein